MGFIEKSFFGLDRPIIGDSGASDRDMTHLYNFFEVWSSFLLWILTLLARVIVQISTTVSNAGFWAILGLKTAKSAPI